jgi:predicted small secreted protein
MKRVISLLLIALFLSMVLFGCANGNSGAGSESPDHAYIRIVSVTSLVSPGAYATLEAKATPGAECTITVYYKSGPSEAQGLYPKQANSNGHVSWTWKVGTRTTPGRWKIVVTATYEGKTVSQQTHFTVQ